MDCLGKLNFMLYTLNFRKEVGYMFFSFACILNAPNIQDETTCINFIGKTLNAQLQNRMRLKKILIKKKNSNVEKEGQKLYL